MVTVKNANVVLEINEEEVDKYFEKGFSVIDKFGNVIKASVPRDIGALQKAYKDHEDLIKAQEKQIEALKKENENLIAMLSAKPKQTSSAPSQKKVEPTKQTTNTNANKTKVQ